MGSSASSVGRLVTSRGSSATPTRAVTQCGLRPVSVAIANRKVPAPRGTRTVVVARPDDKGGVGVLCSQEVADQLLQVGFAERLPDPAGGQLLVRGRRAGHGGARPLRGRDAQRRRLQRRPHALVAAEPAQRALHGEHGHRRGRGVGPLRAEPLDQRHRNVEQGARVGKARRHGVHADIQHKGVVLRCTSRSARPVRRSGVSAVALIKAGTLRAKARTVTLASCCVIKATSAADSGAPACIRSSIRPDTLAFCTSCGGVARAYVWAVVRVSQLLSTSHSIRAGTHLHVHAVHARECLGAGIVALLQQVLELLHGHRFGEHAQLQLRPTGQPAASSGRSSDRAYS